MSEQETLLIELENLSTTHKRRLEIGDRLNEIGDIRPGVGLNKNGLPDILWLPVVSGGNITLKNKNVSFAVPPFYIAKYPITYAQYEAFVEVQNGYTNPEWWKGMPKEHQKQALKEQYTKSWNNPRDSLSWYQSVAFARWLNYRLSSLKLPNLEGISFIVGQNAQVRLPLEWEWQWAAQNSIEQHQYPWGDWQKGYANTVEAGLKRAVAVGMYPQGVVECGALDMAGNLSEWCANDCNSIKTVDVGNGQTKVYRGGSFYRDRICAGVVARNYYDPHKDYNFLGVRVVISTPIEGF